jgi:RHS repeat-associated protein
VDGNTNGNWSNGSVTHTNSEAGAWWQVDLGGMQVVQSVEVWNRTDCCGERLTNFNVMLLDSNQAVVASTNVSGQAGTPTTVQLNGTARYVKIQLMGTDYLSLAEVKVWGTVSAPSGSYGALQRLNVSAGRVLAVDEVQTDGTKVTSYLMADRQGSTRVLMNAAGAVTSRHDYFPFGEELGAGTGAPGSPTGMRTAAQGYSAADNVRDRYAGTRLDDATGLDHTLWRKLETRSGRWTTPDPYGKSLRVTNPQSFNRYAYVHNDPVNFVDRSGLDDEPIEPWDGTTFTTNTLDERPYGGVRFVDEIAPAASPNEGSTEAGLIDPQNPGEGVTPCNKSRLAPYFPGVDLDSIKIHFGFPANTRLAGAVLNYFGIRALNGATAITIGNDIYFRSTEVYNPDTATGIGDIAHEIRHVEQQRRPNYSYANYVAEYAELRRLGFDDNTAYRNTTDEKEAFKTGALVQKDLENLQKQLNTDNSPCPPRSP